MHGHVYIGVYLLPQGCYRTVELDDVCIASACDYWSITACSISHAGGDAGGGNSCKAANKL